MGGQAEEEEQKKRKKSIFLHFACCFSALFRFPPNCVLRVYWFSVCKRKRKNFCIPKVAEELFGFFTFAMPLSGYRATVLESTESQQKYFCVRRKSYDGKLFFYRNFLLAISARARPGEPCPAEVSRFTNFSRSKVESSHRTMSHLILSLSPCSRRRGGQAD
jgi:hypothetical protein